MTKYKTGGLLAVRLNSCQIARKSQDFSHVILLAFFLFYRSTKEVGNMILTDFVLRISLSLELGFLIGLERQLTGHPAGIRINF